MPAIAVEDLVLVPVRHENPGPGRLLLLLDGLDAPPGAFTLVLEAGASIDRCCTAADPPGLRATLAQLSNGQGGFADGLVLFGSPDAAFAVRPPLPPSGTSRLSGWDPAPLLEILGRPRLLAVLLLRRGGFSVGVFNGDVLVASKTGARFVKNRHRKGGQSQRRFDRIREKQVDELLEKVCDTAREKFEPYAERLDALYLGGDRRTVQAFRQDCQYLNRFGPRLQSRFITTPEPRQETLRLAYDMIWRSEWTELRPQSESRQPPRSDGT